jgi:hypothetical protein
MNTAMRPPDSPAAKTWSVQIEIGEYEGTTRAIAHLHTADRTALTGTGTARLNPADPDIPEIGDELAASRALSELAHRLLDAAADDMSGVLHKPVDLTR